MTVQEVLNMTIGVAWVEVPEHRLYLYNVTRYHPLIFADKKVRHIKGDIIEGFPSLRIVLERGQEYERE